MRISLLIGKVMLDLLAERNSGGIGNDQPLDLRLAAEVEAKWTLGLGWLSGRAEGPEFRSELAACVAGLRQQLTGPITHIRLAPKK
jgi:hypothetical protein